MLKFKSTHLSFLQGVFTTINCFCFILQNTLCDIELLAEYRYLFHNCYSGYYVIEWFSTVRLLLIVKTFHENGKCGTQTMRKRQTIFYGNEALCVSTCTLTNDKV